MPQEGRLLGMLLHDNWQRTALDREGRGECRDHAAAAQFSTDPLVASGR